MLPIQAGGPSTVPALARSVPEVLMLACEPIPVVKDGRLSSLIENHVETAQLYHECSERHEALVAIIRTMQNQAQGRARAPAQRRVTPADPESWPEAED